MRLIEIFPLYNYHTFPNRLAQSLLPIEEEEQVSDRKKESTSSATTATPNPLTVGNDETRDKKNRNRWSRKKIFDNSRKFNLDLVPRLLYSRGAMVELLISSNISRYTEFKVYAL